MPTHNRRRFVSQAIRYFARQDYPSRELIIVDDGQDAIGDLVPDDGRIHYVRLEKRQSVGAKRNLACRRARGDLIAHWDDDDWMATNRLSTQAAELLATDAQVCAARQLLYYHLESGQAWLYRPRTGDRSWLASSTLLYHRKLWETHPFAEGDAADVAAFVAPLNPARVRVLDDPQFYIALLHGENSTPRNLSDLRWQRKPTDIVGERLGRDREFYTVLRNGRSASAADPRYVYLVSCIMPTHNRHAFVPQAVRYFLRQDYPLRELIVVDDGTESVRDLIADDERIQYIRLSKRHSIGEKRNLACEAARGKIILLWDDDDWHGHSRISYQVMPLIEGRAEVTGLDNSLVFSLPTDQFWACTADLHQRLFPKGIISGTIAFWKGMWGPEGRFPDRSLGEDADFVKSLIRRGARLDRLANAGTFVYVRHDANTWQFVPGAWVDKSAWHKVQPPPYMPPEDLRFYRSLGKAAPTLSRKPSGPHRKQVHRDRRTASSISVTGFPPVSACLLSYKRPRNLQPIVDSLHSYSFIDEILVWNNNLDVKLKLSGDKVRVLNARENTICLGRFQCAKQARNRIIYVQDDDVLVKNVPTLYRSFLKDDSRITHALSPQHYGRRERRVYNKGHDALLGWGAFFKKEWLSVLDDQLESGDDLVFRRSADKFFTLLLGHRHRTLLAEIEMLPYSTSPGIALYKDPNHRLMEALGIRRALASLRESRGVRFPVTWNVVVVCHNYARYLQEAIHSVLLNDADYVITIVDDASTDETPGICSQLRRQYPWISVVRHDQNVEVSRARNSGVSHIDSLFVVLLDADDKIGPDYLYEAEQLLRSGYDIANPDAILFGSSSSRWPVPDTISLPMLLERNRVHCCAAFRRSYWAQVGGIDENMDNWQDYDLWIRMAAQGARIRRLGGDHFYYRKHGKSKSTESARKREHLHAFLREKHSDLYAKHKS
jgi:glycosyltransferase involved in cell wall biosynthesis